MHRQSTVRWAVLLSGLLACTGAYGRVEEESKSKAHEASHGHTHEAQPGKEDERQSNDRQIEIAAAGDNLWDLKTKSRLVKMRLLDRDGKAYAEFLPFSYDGPASPFAADNALSLEIDPGTDRAQRIPLLKEGPGGRLVTAEPLPSTAAFDAALYMDEKDHIHRLRFRFPGAK